MAVRGERDEIAALGRGRLEDLRWRTSEGEACLDIEAGACAKLDRVFLKVSPVSLHLLGLDEIELIEVARDPAVGDVDEEQLRFRKRSKPGDRREQELIGRRGVECDEDFTIHAGMTRMRLTTDDTDDTDGFATRLLKSVPSVPCVFQESAAKARARAAKLAG